MAYPKEYRYTKEHEWIEVKDGIATIGITDYAQHELGDVVFVEMPAAGAKVTAGKTFGSVESVKAVSEIYAPATGEVTEANAALQSQAGDVEQRSARRRLADQSEDRESRRRSIPLWTPRPMKRSSRRKQKEASA